MATRLGCPLRLPLKHAANFASSLPKMLTADAQLRCTDNFTSAMSCPIPTLSHSWRRVQ